MNAVASFLSQPGLTAELVATPRKIRTVTTGYHNGPITRLVSPSDLGQWIKPFVFLDAGVVPPSSEPLFGIHPHSGIATLTVVLEGQLAYEDTTGKQGEVLAGGLEWMKAAGGVWHDGYVTGDTPMKLFQLWVALPPDQENGTPESQYIAPEDVLSAGPARVLLGHYQGVNSPIRSPAGITYLHVQLKAGEHWRFQPNPNETVAWMALHQGTTTVPEGLNAGDMVIFEETEHAIDIVAHDDVSFVLGAAVKHPYPLVTGKYSVHTNAHALAKGEAEIASIGRQLRAVGRLK
ncbi:Redox-sensitive bicupin YhaK, pirin superfamily [Dyella sp. OK004]|uniref:pirin family protein n=1 Tax=Dyella sp. OK004 TaxID=1855292 RepID=UPI0008EAF01B|nr:pirin family protein [Dyella sp. OK004]SFS00446.1 Redox-sensitive bicupin YhaK, pirin superfamily [Dyella sp. OK004]